MSNNKTYYSWVPAFVIFGFLCFIFFSVGAITYHTHLENKKKEELNNVDIAAKAKEFNAKLSKENEELKKMDDLFV